MNQRKEGKFAQQRPILFQQMRKAHSDFKTHRVAARWNIIWSVYEFQCCSS